MTLSWDSIPPEQFEELCYHLLESLGFANLAWHGKRGSDRGRDLTAQRVLETLPGTNQVTQWVVQCKRYTKKPLPKSEVDDAIVSAKEHRPGYLLIITTTDLTSATHDWLNSVKKDLSFQVETWEGHRLESLLRERVDKLRPYLPEKLRRELQVAEFAPSSEITRLEDLLSRSTVSSKRSLKEQIFGATDIPQNDTPTGPVYGQSVVLGNGCFVKGDVYARRELKIHRGSAVNGSVLCPGNIELVECELVDVCGSQITMQGPCVVKGKLVTDRDLYVPPESKISTILCGGRKLELGERSEIENIACKGVTILGDDAKVAEVLKSTDVRLRPGCVVGWIAVDGDLTVPEGASIGNLSTRGSVKVDHGAQITRLNASGDVELLSGGSLEELACRNLVADGGLRIKNLRSTGAVTVKGDDATYQGKFISANGDVVLPEGADVEVLSSQGDVTLGKGCHVRYLVARNLNALDNLESAAIRCTGSVELGENCKVGSLQAVGSIKFKEGFQSLSWTIFSEKGGIQGNGSVKLGDIEIPAEAAFRYKEGTLLSSLTQKEQMELIDGLEKSGG